MRIYNEKNGAVLILVIFFTVIIAIVAGACYFTLSNFSNFATKHHDEVSSGYIAECGIYRGKWLLDEDAFSDSVDPVAGNVYQETLVVDGKSVAVDITYNGKHSFNIVSSALGTSIDIDYVDTKIVSWE